MVDYKAKYNQRDRQYEKAILAAYNLYLKYVRKDEKEYQFFTEFETDVLNDTLKI